MKKWKVTGPILIGVIIPALLAAAVSIGETSDAWSKPVPPSSVENFLIGGRGAEVWYFPITGGTVDPGSVIYEFGDAIVAASAIADHDNDLDHDFVVMAQPVDWQGIPTGETDLYLFENTGSTFDVSQIEGSLPMSGGFWFNLSDITAEDFCTDDHHDFVVSIAGEHSTKLYLFEYDPAGRTFVQTFIDDATWAGHAARMDAGDAEKDNHQDFLIFDHPSKGNFRGDIYLYRGDGDGSFSSSFACQTPHSVNDIAVADFNNDNYLDLLVGLDDDGDPGGVWLYVGDNSGTFTLTSPTPAFDLDPQHNSGNDHHAGGGSMDACDVDHDGDPDIVALVRGTDSPPFNPTLWLIKSTGNGTFEPPALIQTGIGVTGDLLSISAPLRLLDRPLKEKAIDELQDVKPTGDKKLDKKIDKVIRHIEKSLKDKLWIDKNHLDPKRGKKVFYEEKKAAKDLMKLTRKPNVPEEIKVVLSAVTLKLVDADSLLARTAIDDAIAAGGRKKEIEKAEKEMAKAEKDKSKARYDKAIDHYKHAWEHAQKAMKKHKKPKHEQIGINDRGTPEVFSLSQNYPNPVSKLTIIQYALPEDSHVKLEIYNTAGQKVMTVVDEDQEAGYRSTDLTTERLSAGIYFYRLKAGDHQSTRKMTVLK